MTDEKNKILIVDDEQNILWVLKKGLEKKNYLIDTASSGEEALKHLGSNKYLMMFSDIFMEGINGLKLLEQVRISSPDLKVVMMTAQDTMNNTIEAMRLGAYDYITKPFDFDHIFRLIEQAETAKSISAPDSIPKDKNQEAGMQATPGPFAIIGKSKCMQDIFKTIGKSAGSDLSVLITGESGTGKEMVAGALHQYSPRKEKSFVCINCAAISRELLESELFGHVRGAFTGAVAGKKGYFELAGKGTIFLDEIGDTSPEFQSKLLRVLQERQFYPVGGEQPKTTGARVVAATHQHMEDLVMEGGFREDLYFRLRVVEIQVPSLREREGDIPLLAEHLLARVRSEIGSSVDKISEEAMACLEEYEWPGNVRELENVLTRAAMVARNQIVVPEHLTLGAWKKNYEGSNGKEEDLIDENDMSLSGTMEHQIIRVMKYTDGNKTRAAKLLKISRSVLAGYLKEFDL